MKIECINSTIFSPFGTVLEFPEDSRENFRIIDMDETSPWRIAVFRYCNKGIKIIEHHPDSKESFEPLKGVTVLLVAPNDAPEECRAFLLDKPICLKKGIWHQVLALTPEAEVKITENLEVESKFYEYSSEKTIALI